MNNKKYVFTAPLIINDDKIGAYIVFPYDLRKEFNKGRIKVRAMINDIPYTGSIVNMGVKDSNNDICYIMGILKSIYTKLNKHNGDLLNLVIEPLE